MHNLDNPSVVSRWTVTTNTAELEFMTFAHQPPPMMFALYFACILSLLVTSVLAMPAPTCSLGKHPIDKDLFSKKISAFSGCSRGGITANHNVRIEPWAVIYQPFNFPQTQNGPLPTCREEIISVYRRSNVVPKLYYRPAKFVPFDCTKIPIEKIMAWGPGRNRFKSLVMKMEVGIKDIRATDCNDEFSGLKPQLSRQEVNDKLNRERITTAALTYINGVAFNSYLCV